MSDEYAYSLPTFLQTMASTWRVAAPVGPEAQIASATISEPSAGAVHLRLTFTAPVQPRHMLEGTVQEVGANDILVRAGVQPALAAHVYFEEQHFTHVHYVSGGAVDPAAAGPAGQTRAPGTAIPTTTSTLEIGFYQSTATGKRYIHPALVLRMLAFFASDVDALLRRLLELDPSAPFFLDAFLAYLDAAVTQRKDSAPFLGYLLLREYENIRNAVSLSQTARVLYEGRLQHPLAARIALTDLIVLIQDAATFQTAMATNPDRMHLWHVYDKHLWLLLVEALSIGIDPIYVSNGFTSMWNKDEHRFIVDESYLAIFNGQFAGQGPGVPLPAEGRVKLRGNDEVLDEIDKILPWRQEAVRAKRAQRYHYLQRPDKTVVFARGPLPASTPASPIATGCDDLPAAIIGGAVIPRTDLDVQAFANRTGKDVGLPMLGRAINHGKTYFFWLARQDFGSTTRPDASSDATYDEMVGLLVLLGATDAVILDGSDSVGLIVKGQGIIPGLQPGPVKNYAIPTAIGFRKLP
jgi:hypothetical protein